MLMAKEPCGLDHLHRVETWRQFTDSLELTLTIRCGSVDDCPNSTETGLTISGEGKVMLHDAGVGCDAMLATEWRLFSAVGDAFAA